MLRLGGPMLGRQEVPMNRTVMALVVAALCFAGALRMAHADATTSPGKTSVYATEENVALSGTTVVAVSVILEKGKKKRVLEVEGRLDKAASDGEPLVARVTVNGVRMEPPDPFFANLSARASQSCSPGLVCSMVGTWWLDLDAAEAANPGTFIGQPLTIELNAGSSNPTVATASLRARLQKK
jgi:hypothetical protein